MLEGETTFTVSSGVSIYGWPFGPDIDKVLEETGKTF